VAHPDVSRAGVCGDALHRAHAVGDVAFAAGAGAPVGALRRVV